MLVRNIESGHILSNVERSSIQRVGAFLKMRKCNKMFRYTKTTRPLQILHHIVIVLLRNRITCSLTLVQHRLFVFCVFFLLVPKSILIILSSNSFEKSQHHGSLFDLFKSICCQRQRRCGVRPMRPHFSPAMPFQMGTITA